MGSNANFRWWFNGIQVGESVIVPTKISESLTWYKHTLIWNRNLKVQSEKKFSLARAMNGSTVRTISELLVRIISFDGRDDAPIAAWVGDGYGGDNLIQFYNDGTPFSLFGHEYGPEMNLYTEKDKHTGWVNLVKCGCGVAALPAVFKTEGEAISQLMESDQPVPHAATVKIEWESDD